VVLSGRTAATDAPHHSDLFHLGPSSRAPDRGRFTRHEHCVGSGERKSTKKALLGGCLQLSFGGQSMAVGGLQVGGPNGYENDDL
jgi:hypothetical protein